LAGGWCYVREIVMPAYAQAFAQAGVNAMIFDYRNLGVSDGDNRQHLDPWAQIRDYQNALSFLERRDDVDPQRIGVWGISYSGGHALILAAIDPRVKSIVSQIPVIDGYENMRRAHGTMEYRRLWDLILKDRKLRYERRGSASICLMRRRIRRPKFRPGPSRRRSGPSLRSRTPRRRSIKTGARSSRSTSS
jgi:dipeptidyl aminopeptidase/acylaminoacyl peptidase